MQSHKNSRHQLRQVSPDESGTRTRLFLTAAENARRANGDRDPNTTAQGVTGGRSRWSCPHPPRRNPLRPMPQRHIARPASCPRAGLGSVRGSSKERSRNSECGDHQHHTAATTRRSGLGPASTSAADQLQTLSARGPTPTRGAVVGRVRIGRHQTAAAWRAESASCATDRAQGVEQPMLTLVTLLGAAVGILALNTVIVLTSRTPIRRQGAVPGRVGNDHGPRPCSR